MSVELPIYPKARDLIIVIETIEEIMGGGANSILFRIGDKMGRRYALDILRNTDDRRVGDTLNFLQYSLKNLIASGWFSSVIVEKTHEGIDVEIQKPFEFEANRNRCDFLRGFVSGLYTTISGFKSISDESPNPSKNRTVIKLRDIE